MLRPTSSLLTAAAAVAALLATARAQESKLHAEAQFAGATIEGVIDRVLQDVAPPTVSAA